MAFLTARMLGLARGWWLLIAIVLAAGAILFANRRFDNRIDEARQSGATAQREADLRETLNRTEEAHAARDEVRDPGSSAAYDQCLRTARTPGNCERFLPRK